MQDMTKGIPHIGLIMTIAKRYLPLCDRASDIDDLIQAGAIGVMRAEETFSPTKGAFSSWAVFYIQNELQAALGLRGTRIRAHREAVSLDAQTTEEMDGTLADTIADPSADIEAEQEQAELVAAVRQRVEAMENERQREIVQRCDLGGQMLAEAGKALGLTVAGASDLKRRAHNVLRKDKPLAALAEAHNLDKRTNWYLRGGFASWRTDWMSSTERVAFWRMTQGGGN